jgi:hypothetical protein
VADQVAALRGIDERLESGQEEAALRLMAELKAAGTLRGFDGARRVPKRIYTLEELRLNKIDAAALLSPTDRSLNTVRSYAQVCETSMLACPKPAAAHCVLASLRGMSAACGTCCLRC